MYISILLHLSVAVQVWPQAAFRQHPFLVADLPQQPDIGDLYRYIFAWYTWQKVYIRNEQVYSLIRLVQYSMLHDFSYWTAAWILSYFLPMYISILLHLSVAVQVWPQAAFRQHPFLVADLPQQPDIGDLYRYIFAWYTWQNVYIRNEQVYSLIRLVQYIMLHDFSYRTADFYLILDQCIFLYSCI